MDFMNILIFATPGLFTICNKGFKFQTDLINARGGGGGLVKLIKSIMISRGFI